MNAAYYLLAIAAGLGITLQTTLNGQLAKGVGGDSVAAALFSFTAGAACLGIFSLMRGAIAASLVAIPAQPWWSLLGGLLGAGALLSYVVLAPKIVCQPCSASLSQGRLFRHWLSIISA